jgi:hypothetical protein
MRIKHITVISLILIAAYFVGVALLGAGIGALATSLIWASLGSEPSGVDHHKGLGSINRVYPILVVDRDALLDTPRLVMPNEEIKESAIARDVDQHFIHRRTQLKHDPRICDGAIANRNVPRCAIVGLAIIQAFDFTDRAGTRVSELLCNAQAVFTSRAIRIL